MVEVVFNPNHGDPDKRDSFLEDCASSSSKGWTRWTCKSTAKPGNLTLFYFGAPGSSIVGVGVVSSEVEREDGDFEWKEGRTAFFCEYEPVVRLRTPITMDDMAGERALASWWAAKPYRGSPKSIPEHAATVLLHRIAAQGGRAGKLVEGMFELRDPGAAVGDDEEALEFKEGATRARFVRHRQREGKARKAKIRQVLAAAGRLVCEVPGCGFDFKARYGKLGEGFAHVHHRRPLSSGKGERITKLGDLAIVCPNCHAMIHRGGQSRALGDVVPPRRKRLSQLGSRTS